MRSRDTARLNYSTPEKSYRESSHWRKSLTFFDYGIKHRQTFSSSQKNFLAMLFSEAIPTKCWRHTLRCPENVKLFFWCQEHQLKSSDSVLSAGYLIRIAEAVARPLAFVLDTRMEEKHHALLAPLMSTVLLESGWVRINVPTFQDSEDWARTCVLILFLWWSELPRPT